MAMPIVMEHPERPTLQINYETDLPVGAVEFGGLVQELGKGFDRFARGRRLRNLRLIVVGAGLGSHWLDLAVVGASTAVGAAIKYRKEIYDFADFLGKLFDIAKNLRRVETKAADRKLIDAINAPVARGQATQVNITVLGGAPVITVSQQIAQTFWSVPDEENVKALPLPPTAVSRRREKVDADAVPALRHLEGHFGTIFDVKGQWYVRLEGEQGVMNPVSLAPGVTVEDDRAYLLDGSWEGRRYSIRRAAPI